MGLYDKPVWILKTDNVPYYDLTNLIILSNPPKKEPFHNIGVSDFRFEYEDVDKLVKGTTLRVEYVKVDFENKAVYPIEGYIIHNWFKSDNEVKAQEATSNVEIIKY